MIAWLFAAAKASVSPAAIVGIIGAGLLASVAVQSWRLQSAQHELSTQRAAIDLAVSRVEALSRERRALQATLAEREAAHTEIARLRRSQAVRLAQVERDAPEVRDVLDLAIPEPVRLLLTRPGDSGPGATTAAGGPPRSVPAPGESRPNRP